MAKDREQLGPREYPDQTDRVIQLITEAAVGAPEGTIAYYLGRGLAHSLTLDISDVSAIQTAVIALLKNKVPAQGVHEPYAQLREFTPTPLQEKIAALQSHLNTRQNPFIWYFHNLNPQEVGAYVGHESDQYKTLVFTNPNTNQLVSFSLIGGWMAPNARARVGVLPYDRLRGQATTSILFPPALPRRRLR